ncbi:MAG: hypothetical protein HYV07_05670 [Deltaproteobacteria bacterium]|nr:hypothetical protein [Deltaproteobacteria bacterium]
MSAEHPETLAEWREHIATLEGDALREKTIAANTGAFVRALVDEGMSAGDVHGIFVALAKRFEETGQRAPGEGFYDLEALARQT